jgi:hypothetical protein
LWSTRWLGCTFPKRVNSFLLPSSNELIFFLYLTNPHTNHGNNSLRLF